MGILTKIVDFFSTEERVPPSRYQPDNFNRAIKKFGPIIGRLECHWTQCDSWNPYFADHCGEADKGMPVDTCLMSMRYAREAKGKKHGDLQG